MMAKKTATDSAAGTGTDADTLAFRAAVRDVKPLAHRAPPPGLEKPRARVRRRAAPPDAALAAASDLAAAMPIIEPDAATAVAGADPLVFRRPGVRTQVMRRLRRGLYPIDDELDLHGLSQAEARARLADFLTFSRNAGYECVRIIHGKGYRSGARGPILKTAVNAWLRRHFDVLAFTSARVIDGGTGAVYVLLRA